MAHCFADLPRKPMARVQLASLFEREFRLGLSSAAIQLVFEEGSVLSEGSSEGSGYYGSTMITVDGTRVARRCAEICDVSTMRRLAILLGKDERFLERARHIGTQEARRLAGSPIAQPRVDVNVRVSGTHLHIDLDVEAASFQMRAL